MSWIRALGTRVQISFHVVPGARKTELQGLFGESQNERLKIKIAAPPVDDAANTALREFVSDLLGISMSCVQISKGSKSRKKDVLIESQDVESVQNKFAQVVNVSIK